MLESRDGRVVELVDSLDSGSSVHCGRAGSSPASPTKSTLLGVLFLLIGSIFPFTQLTEGERCVSTEKT